MIWIKRLFIALALIVLTALGIGVYLGYKYQDKAVPIIVEQLNQYVLTPVDVKDIQLSFIERFPQASLKLSQVTAMGSDATQPNDTLFHLDEIYLTFNLIDWYKGDYVLNNVEAHNGYLHLNRTKQGSINYRFIDTALSATSTGTFQLDLNRILLNQVQVDYYDQLNGEHIQIDAHRFSAKGTFTDNQQIVALYGSSTIHQFRIGELNYLSNELVSIDAGLEFNPELDFYQISRGILKLKDTYELTLNGKIKGREIDLTASANHLSIEALPTLLPQAIVKPIQDLQGKGSVAVYTHIARTENEEFPSIVSDLTIRDASIKMQALNDPLSITYAKAHYSNGKLRTLATSSLEIDSASIQLGESNLKGKATIRNFNELFFQLKATTDIDGKSLSESIDLDGISSLEGRLTGDFSLKGKLPSDSMSTQQLINWKKSGEFDLEDLVLQTDSMDLKLLSGIVTIEEGSMVIEDAKGSWNGTNLSVSGWSKGGFHALLLGNPPNHFRGELAIDRYIAGSSGEGGFKFPRDFDISADVTINELQYDLLIAKNISTHFSLDKRLNLEKLRAEMLEGTLQGDLSLVPIGRNTRTRLSLSGRHLNIKELFKTFNNFEQTAISHTNLVGFADIDAQFKYQQDEKGNTVLPSVNGNARLRITNGELIEYEPLYGLVEDFRKNKILSFFIKLDDFEQKLHHVRFDTLENTLSIKNNEVFIPEMQIRSSAIDLTLQGKQSFDHDLDYHMSFNLKQVLLANRDKPTPTEYGYIEDDGTGNKMIYLHISGNADNPKVTFDKQAGKKHRKEVVKQEVNTTKAILQEEFGLFKSDSLAPVPEGEPAPKNELDLDEFDEQLENKNSADSTTSSIKKDTVEKKSKWKKLLKKVSGEESNSKFENWEFEENDDW